MLCRRGNYRFLLSKEPKRFFNCNYIASIRRFDLRSLDEMEEWFQIMEHVYYIPSIVASVIQAGRFYPKLRDSVVGWLNENVGQENQTWARLLVDFDESGNYNGLTVEYEIGFKYEHDIAFFKLTWG